MADISKLKPNGATGTEYNIIDDDYRNTDHTFTMNTYDSYSHTFENTQISQRMPVRNVFTAIQSLFNSVKTAINDHGSLFGDIATALAFRVTKANATYKALNFHSYDHTIDDSMELTTQFDGAGETGCVWFTNTNLGVVTHAVNDHAEWIAKETAGSKTVTGNPLTITDAAGIKAEKIVIEFEPKQAGSGTPSPSNIRPITGYTSLSADGCGKNLWGGDRLTNDIKTAYPAATLDTTNKTIYYTGAGIDTKVISTTKYKQNTRYTFIFKLKNITANAYANLTVCYTDNTRETINKSGASANTVVTAVFTSAANKTIDHLEGSYASGNTTLYYEDCGIFEGVVTESAFEAYNGGNVTVQLGQTLYGGKLTILQDGSADIYCDTGFCEFDGSSDENWTLVDNNSIKTDYIFPAMKTATSTWIYAFSSDFSAGADGVAPSTWLTTYATNNPTALEFRNIVSNWGISAYTVNAWKSYLASRSTPLQVAYELKNPFTIHLSPVETLTLLQGINNVWTDGTTLSLTYQPDNAIGEAKIYANEAAEIVAKEYTTETDTTNNTPYLYRASQNSGDRCYLRQLVGASFGVNQLFNVANPVALLPRGITLNVNATTGEITISGTSTGLAYFQWTDVNCPQNHVIYATNGLGKDDDRFLFYNDSNGVSTNNKESAIGRSINSAGHWTLKIASGASFGNGVTIYPQIIDLTQWFNAQIADYAATAGFSWLRNQGHLTKDYYPYNTGSLQSVNTSGKVNTGKNYIDFREKTPSIQSNGITWEVFDDGRIKAKGTATGRSQIYIALNQTEAAVLSGKYFTNDIPSNMIAAVELADSPYTIFANNNEVIKAPTGTVTIYFRVLSGNSVDCVFAPRVLENSNSIWFFQLPNIDLRGVPKLVDNNIVYDGDVRDESGVITRKYGIVDLGTQNFATAGVTSVFSLALYGRKDGSCKMKISNSYSYANPYHSDNDKCYIENSDSGNIKVYFKDSAYTDPAAFKTAMSGVYLVYELATPTTEQTTPIQNPQIYNSNGTEQFIDNRTVPIPVGHNSEYVNLPDWMENGYVEDLRYRVDDVITKKLDDSLVGNYSENLFDINSNHIMYAVYGGSIVTGTSRGTVSAYSNGIKSSNRNTSAAIAVLLGYLSAGTYTLSVGSKNATMYINTTEQTYPADGVQPTDIASTETNSITFTINQSKYVELALYTSSNVEIYCTDIQLERGTKTTYYKPYIPTNKELWEMIKALQS